MTKIEIIEIIESQLELNMSITYKIIDKRKHFIITSELDLLKLAKNLSEYDLEYCLVTSDNIKYFYIQRSDTN